MFKKAEDLGVFEFGHDTLTRDEYMRINRRDGDQSQPVRFHQPPEVSAR